MPEPGKFHWVGDRLILTKTGQIVGKIDKLGDAYLASPWSVLTESWCKSTMWETHEAAKAGLVKRLEDAVG